MLLTSCFDSNYDLTKIDDSLRLEMHDLSLDLSVKDVRLGGVIKAEDGDKIQIVKDEHGDSIFAVLVEGDFESESVTIDDESIRFTENILVGEDEKELFTGDIEYQFGKFDIPDVDLSSVPSFLKGSDTRIVLSNPQIYLELFNPLTSYGAMMEAGLLLLPKKGNEMFECAIDEGKKLSTDESNRLSTYVLSPQKPDAFLEGYNNPVHIPFTALKHILDTGKGVPERIGVEVVEATLPHQHVSNVPLHKTIGGIEGYYTFYVPLEFDEGTTIVYTDTIKGWGEDVKNGLNIRQLCLSGKASLRMPVEETEVVVEPIIEDGKIMPSQSFVLKQGDSDVPFTIDFCYMDSPLVGLTSLVLKARLPMKSGEVLKPSYGVDLKDVKIKFDGYYEK